MLYFSIQNASPRWDGYKVSEAAGARWRFYRRIILGSCLNCCRIVFILAEAIPRFPIEILIIEFVARAVFVVSLADGSCCSAHRTGRFMWDKDQSWESFFVAGAVFGDVGGWLMLLHALYWTFHMWCFILRGRRNILWSWRVTHVAPRIALDVSCQTRINHE